MWLKTETGALLNLDQVETIQVDIGAEVNVIAFLTEGHLRVRRFQSEDGAQRFLSHLAQHLADREMSMVWALTLRGDE